MEDSENGRIIIRLTPNSPLLNRKYFDGSKIIFYVKITLRHFKKHEIITRTYQTILLFILKMKCKTV